MAGDRRTAEKKGVVRSMKASVSAHIKPGDILIEIDPRYFRPTEVDYLLADASKAKKKAGLVAENYLRGTGKGHGGCRPGADQTAIPV